MNKLLAVLNVVTFSSVLILLAVVLTGGSKSNVSLGTTISGIDRHQELVDRLAAVELALQSVLRSASHDLAATQLPVKASAEPGKMHVAKNGMPDPEAPDNSAQHVAARQLTDTIIQSGNLTAKQSIELRGALGQLQDRQQARRLMKEIVIAINNDELKLDPSAFL